MQTPDGSPEHWWGKCFEVYLLDVRSRRLSYKHERRAMKLLSDFYHHTEAVFPRVPNPWEIRPDFILTWLNSHGWQRNTIHSWGHLILRFFKCAWESQTLKEKPRALSLKPPKKEARRRDVLTPDELGRIHNHLYSAGVRTSRNTLRNRVVFELCLLGLRASEMATLKWSDLKTDSFEIRIPKTGRIRIFPISAALRTALSEWSPACPRETKYVLKYEVPRGEGDSEMAHSAVTSVVMRLLNQAGIKRDSYLGPHLFRHSVATILYEQTEDLERVRNLLGHKYLDTTRGYIHLPPKKLEESLNVIRESFIAAQPPKGEDEDE